MRALLICILCALAQCKHTMRLQGAPDAKVEIVHRADIHSQAECEAAFAAADPQLCLDDERLMRQSFDVRRLSDAQLQLWIHWLSGSPPASLLTLNLISNKVLSEAFGSTFTGAELTDAMAGRGMLFALLGGIKASETDLERLFGDGRETVLRAVLKATAKETLGPFLAMLPNSVLRRHAKTVLTSAASLVESYAAKGLSFQLGDLPAPVLTALFEEYTGKLGMAHILSVLRHSGVVEAVADNDGIVAADLSPLATPSMRVRLLPVECVARMDTSAPFWKQHLPLLTPAVLSALPADCEACRTLPLHDAAALAPNIAAVSPECLAAALHSMYNGLTPGHVTSALGGLWPIMGPRVLLPLASDSRAGDFTAVSPDDIGHMTRDQLQNFVSAVPDDKCALLVPEVFGPRTQTRGMAVSRACFEALDADTQLAAARNGATVADPAGLPVTDALRAKLAALPKEDLRQLYYVTAVAPEGNSALESFLLDALK